MDSERINSMGWERDLPDVRDLSAGAPQVDEVLAKSRPMKAVKKALPAKVDLTKWCSPIEDQGRLGSYTANAGAGLMEYFERRAFGRHLDASRLFLYKVTRNLLGWKGDQGTELGLRPALIFLPEKARANFPHGLFIYRRDASKPRQPVPHHALTSCF